MSKRHPPPAAAPAPIAPPTVEDVLAAHTPDPLEAAKLEEVQAAAPAVPAPPAVDDGFDDAPAAPPAGAPPPPRWEVLNEKRVSLGDRGAIMRRGKILSHEWADRLDTLRAQGVQLRELPPA